MFSHFSVELKISKEDTTASSVMHLEWRVKKGEVEVMKYVLTLLKVCIKMH